MTFPKDFNSQKKKEMVLNKKIVRRERKYFKRYKEYRTNEEIKLLYENTNSHIKNNAKKLLFFI